MTRLVAIDFESKKISNEAPVPKDVCLSWAELSKSGLIVTHAETSEFLRGLLESSSDVIIIAHNATFELLVTYKNYPELRELIWDSLEKGKWYCTQLGQQLLNNVSKRQVLQMSLAGLVKHYKKKDISEDKKNPDAWRLRYSELDGVPLSDWPEAAIKYAINDSIYALQIYHFQQRQNKNLKLKEHMKAAFALNVTTERGLLIDQDRVDVLEREIKAIIEPDRNNLEALGYMSRTKTGNLTKNVKMFREYIQNTFTNLLYTDKGAIAVSKEALDAYILEKPDSILDSFIHMSKFEKALSTYVIRLKQADPVIRTSYNAIVSSGRTSARSNSIYPSVNIQNQPRELKGVTYDIRNCYIPRPGFKFVSIDYNNLELLSVATQLQKLYKRSRMLDLINSGTMPVDLHSMFACELMSSDVGRRVSYEEYMENKKRPEYKKYRDKGKPVTLGVPGGLGYSTMGLQFIQAGIRLKFEVLADFEFEVVARRMLKKYKQETPNLRIQRTGFKKWSLVYDEIVGLKKILFDLYPELELFLTEGHNKFLNGETKWQKDEWGAWEEEPLYKYNALGVERDFCSYTATCNGYLMQSPSGVGAKNVMYKATRHFEHSDDLHILGFLHDEILAEVRDDGTLITNIETLAEIMIDGMQEVLTGTRVAVEAAVMDYWDKNVNIWDRVYFKNANDGELRHVK